MNLTCLDLWGTCKVIRHTETLILILIVSEQFLSSFRNLYFACFFFLLVALL